MENKSHWSKPRVEVEIDAFNERQVKKRVEAAQRSGNSALDLRDLGLDHIPTSVLEIRETITTLLLGNTNSRLRLAGVSYNLPNNIADLSLLEQFPNLKNLSVSGMPLISNENFRTLHRLEGLDLSYTDITYLDLKEFVSLKVLNLEGNKRMEIPFFSLLALESLNLKATSPDALMVLFKKKLPLVRLDISDNPGAATKLSVLSLLKELQVLKASGCGIRFARDLPALKKLKELDLSDNQLEKPEHLVQLINLEYLNLSKNRLTDLEFLIKFRKLKQLYLDRSQITDLHFLTALPSLTQLSLANNKIKNIRPLARLTSLEYLNLRKNEITDVSPLKNLFKKNGKIKLVFQRENWAVSNRKGVILSDNPITNPPFQYLKAGAEAILSYWQQQTAAKASRESRLPVNEAKLILVGNSHVGKSTLAHLLRNKALPGSSLPSTHGLEFSAWQPDWTINGQKLTINIIDFGGQEYYHDTHHLFFNDKAAYLLLWEPQTNVNKKIATPAGLRDRSELIRHFTLEYWLNAIEIYGGASLTIRVDPREDDEEDGDLDTEENAPAVTKDVQFFTSPPVLLVRTFANLMLNTLLNLKDLEKIYVQLAGSVAIDMDVKKQRTRGIEILQLMIRDMFERMPEHFGQTYFASWISIRKYIEEKETDQYLILSIEQFRTYFLANSGTKMAHSEENIRTLCITLDYWGAVLYKYEMEGLRDLVIVNPRHFTSEVHRLLTEKIRERNGVITREEVVGTLKMEAGRAEAFLGLLKTFKIIFELPRKDAATEPSYISPMYLQERPGYVDLFLSNFTAFYRIKYQGYFHRGILLDCFHQLGKDLYFEKGLYFYWQWGLVLKKDSRVICIEFDEENLNQVLIKMSRNGKEKPGDDPLLQHILHSFESINKRYEFQLELSADGDRFIPREQLLKEMKMGLNIFDWEGQKADVRDYLFLLPENERFASRKHVFVSYSSKDRQYLDQLTSHLELYNSANMITYWHDLMLKGREEWDDQIKEEMNSANILIMLLSADYFATNYIRKEEINIALNSLSAAEKKKQVFWVLLRPCNYELFPEVAKYPIYPLKEKDELTGKAYQRAITEHENQDREWTKLLRMIFEEN